MKELNIPKGAKIIPANNRNVIPHITLRGRELKHCSRCDEWKPLDMFYNNKSKADGKSSECKKCRKKMHCQWIMNHRASWNQKQRDITKKARIIRVREGRNRREPVICPQEGKFEVSTKTIQGKKCIIVLGISIVVPNRAIVLPVETRRRTPHISIKGCEYKYCSCCKKWKPLENYHRASRGDGFKNKCIQCHTVECREWRSKNKEHFKEYQRNYARQRFKDAKKYEELLAKGELYEYKNKP